MQDPRAMSQEELSTPKTHKSRKLVYRPLPSGQLKTEPRVLRKIQKTPKRSSKKDPLPTMPQPDRGTPDSLPESGSTDEYRALRRKYLLLEEESFSLDKDLSEAEAEVKTLEDEKFALLDQLVVLEGLVNPSQLQPQGRM